jgi:hypothetical protein
MNLRAIALALALSCGLGTIVEAKQKPVSTNMGKVSKAKKVKPRKAKKPPKAKRVKAKHPRHV